MKLYWNFITGVTERIYVATIHNLPYGQRIRFRDTVGYIARDQDGSWSAFDGLTNRYLGNEPNKKLAMDIVYNQSVQPTETTGG